MFVNFRLIASYRNQGNKFLSHANEVLMEEKTGALFILPLPTHTLPHTQKRQQKKEKNRGKRKCYFERPFVETNLDSS